MVLCMGDLPGTKSLLDSGLVDTDHVNTVTAFVIDTEARYGCGSDHALLIAKIIFGQKHSVNPTTKTFNVLPGDIGS
jgi:hypothetical protein